MPEASPEISPATASRGPGLRHLLLSEHARDWGPHSLFFQRFFSFNSVESTVVSMHGIAAMKIKAIVAGRARQCASTEARSERPRLLRLMTMNQVEITIKRLQIAVVINTWNPGR